jgi:hypothetical protein
MNKEKFWKDVILLLIEKELNENPNAPIPALMQ